MIKNTLKMHLKKKKNILHGNWLFFLEKKSDTSFFRRSRAANSEVSGGILQKFKLVQDFMVVFVTCKNEKKSTNEIFPHYNA